jgi:hypothetical protein
MGDTAARAEFLAPHPKPLPLDASRQGGGAKEVNLLTYRSLNYGLLSKRQVLIVTQPSRRTRLSDSSRGPHVVSISLECGCRPQTRSFQPARLSYSNPMKGCLLPDGTMSGGHGVALRREPWIAYRA